MATYIMLASFTDQGIRNVKDSPKRTEAFKGMAKKCGANVKDAFWTLGAYDMVAVVEAPDARHSRARASSASLSTRFRASKAMLPPRQPASWAWSRAWSK